MLTKTDINQIKEAINLDKIMDDIKKIVTSRIDSLEENMAVEYKKWKLNSRQLINYMI